jgi:hypothetical protein
MEPKSKCKVKPSDSSKPELHPVRFSAAHPAADGTQAHRWQMDFEIVSDASHPFQM